MLGALTGCNKQAAATGDVVATVNGEAIGAKEYHEYLERKSSVLVQTPQGPQEAQVAGGLGLQALRDLVNQKMVTQLAKDDGLYPSEEDVKKELDFRTKQQPDLVNILTSQGLTLDSIKNDIAFDLSRERLLTKGIVVPMSEVDAYIKDNPTQFVEPAKANLLYIVVTSEDKKKQIDSELSMGQNFQTVATRYSEAPQARQSGGVFPQSVIQAMPSRLQEIVNKTPEMKATDWVKDGGNFVKFFVQKKTKEAPIKMDDVKKSMLQRQLALQRGQMANDLGKRLQEKLQAAKVEVTPKNLKEPWDRAFEQAKTEFAQQKAAAGGTPAGAPGGVPGGAAGAPAVGAPAAGGTTGN